MSEFEGLYNYENFDHLRVDRVDRMLQIPIFIRTNIVFDFWKNNMRTVDSTKNLRIVLCQRKSHESTSVHDNGPLFNGCFITIECIICDMSIFRYIR